MYRPLQEVRGCAGEAGDGFLAWLISGPETGKRKWVARKADGKLTLLVSLGGPTKSRRFWWVS